MSAISVITGGAGGMGLATAKILGGNHHVILADRNATNLENAMMELGQMGIRCDTVICDITDRESVNNLVEQATRHGRLASVVHTAGLSPQMADAETILRVNALGTINITEACFAVAGDGLALVNVASMAGHMLPGLMIPGRVYSYSFSDPEVFLKKLLFRCRLMPSEFYRKGMTYSLSKNFVIWYSRKNAARFGEKGARILSVSPGSFDTAMGRQEEKSGSAEMLKDAAFKRFGKPEEIAEILAFCASDRASYLTGTDVLCDGGVIASRAK